MNRLAAWIPSDANLLKDAFLEMHRRGKTIDLSTHQLEQVGVLCEDVVIIDQGQTIIQGSVRDVKRQEGGNLARLKLDNDPEALWLEQLPGVKVTKRRQDYIEMNIKSELEPQSDCRGSATAWCDHQSFRTG